MCIITYIHVMMQINFEEKKKEMFLLFQVKTKYNTQTSE